MISLLINFVERVFGVALANLLRNYFYKNKKRKQMAKYNIKYKSSTESNNSRERSQNNDGNSQDGTKRAANNKQFAGNVQKRDPASLKSSKPQPRQIAKEQQEKKDSTGSTSQKIINKKTEAGGKSFADQTRSKQGNLVYLVRGKDRGRPAWHYVLVDKQLVSVFLRKTQGGSIDVAKYGKIIKSGWGEDPPQEVVDEIKKQFE